MIIRMTNPLDPELGQLAIDRGAMFGVLEGAGT